MTDLILPVRRKWFEQIKAGTKTEEFRLHNPYWRKRLIGREYDRVIIQLGYPPKSDDSRRIVFPWNGYRVATIMSPEWGDVAQRVFAITLNANQEESR